MPPATPDSPVRARACAHRGDNKIAPENTVPAIALAAEKGAHQIEFDVAMSKDGQLVIMHDPTVDRTTDGTGTVTKMSFDELRRLDAGGWKETRYAGTPIPTFREVLEAASPPVLLNCHLRDTPGLAERTMREIVEMGRVEQCFLACTAAQAREAKGICSEIAICNLDGQGPPNSDYPQRTIDLGAEFIQIWGWDDSMTAVVECLHAAGVLVNYFGTSEEPMMRRLIEAGVDFILTDDLDLMLRVLQDYGIKPQGATEKGTGTI
jgi:glycerophosphoryl diester phosphodiesterase